MNAAPLVSIVLPTFNGQRYLAKAIESCLAQTYDNLELIVVDDCSKDETLKIAHGLAATDFRVRVIHHEINRKLPGALNTGFAAARGELLTWTSDDNIYDSNAIDIMVNDLCRLPEVDFVYYDVLAIDDTDTVLSRWEMKEPGHLREGNCVHACFMYRRSVLEKIGGYREDMFLVEDYEYWLRVYKQCQMKYIKGPAPYRYRRHSQSLSSRRRAEVLLQLCRAKAAHFGNDTEVRKANEEMLWLATWMFRECGNFTKSLQCAMECVRMRPWRLAYWRASVTGALRCVTF